MKKKIIKNEKLVLKKSTIARLNSTELSQVLGGIWTLPKTSATSCGCGGHPNSGGSQNSNFGSCFTCGVDTACQETFQC
jgi:natural product precursor